MRGPHHPGVQSCPLSLIAPGSSPGSSGAGKGVTGSWGLGAGGWEEGPFPFLKNGLFFFFFKIVVKCTTGSASKESACNAGDLGSIPGLGRSLEKGKAAHSSILA